MHRIRNFIGSYNKILKARNFLTTSIFLLLQIQGVGVVFGQLDGYEELGASLCTAAQGNTTLCINCYTKYIFGHPSHWVL